MCDYQPILNAVVLFIAVVGIPFGWALVWAFVQWTSHKLGLPPGRIWKL